MALSRRALQRAKRILTGRASKTLQRTHGRDLDDMERAVRPWLTGPRIVGFGVARRSTNRKRLDELALKVYVDEKWTQAELEAKRLIPSEVTLPGIDGPVPIDVEEIGRIRLEGSGDVAPGDGIVHGAMKTQGTRGGLIGSLGCLVRRTTDRNTLYLLSSTHVIGKFGAARRGENVIEVVRRSGKFVLERPIGKFEAATGLNFGPGFPNVCEASVAKITDQGRIRADIGDFGLPAGTDDTIREGQAVKKLGFRTAYTNGKVIDSDFDFKTRYPTTTGRSRKLGLHRQVLCQRFTDQGDSGAAILGEQSNKILGLHVGASPTGSSVFSRITPILRLLDMQVVTQL